jgi:hypothetical protein
MGTSKCDGADLGDKIILVLDTDSLTPPRTEFARQKTPHKTLSALLGIVLIGLMAAIGHDADDDHIVVANDTVLDIVPRIVLTDGCSGSSFLLQLAGDLLALHDVPLYNPDGQAEPVFSEQHSYLPFLKTIDSSFDDFSEVREGSSIQQEKIFATNSALAKKQQRSYVIKLNPGFGATRYDQIVADTGAMFVQVWRDNTLDMSICEIRDGIHDDWGSMKDLGVQVDSTGKQTCDPLATGEESCFQKHRHAQEGQAVLAKIHTANLQKSFEKKEERRAGLQVVSEDATFSTEELYAYEWNGEAGLETSVPAWGRFLKAWGVSPNMKAIRDHLAREAPYPRSPQSDTLWNVWSVRKWACALDSRKKYHWFFRPELECDDAQNP